MPARPTSAFLTRTDTVPQVPGFLLRAEGIERDVFYMRLPDARREAQWLSDALPHLSAPVILNQDGRLVETVEPSADVCGEAAQDVCG